MRTSIQRVLSAVVLLAWMAPGVGAVGLSMHLAVEHHGHHHGDHHGDHHGTHDGDHEGELRDLLRAAAHGHHHDAEAAPRHDHDARLDTPAPVVRSVPLPVGVVPAGEAPLTGLPALSLLDGSLRRAPPHPLFAAHCSLLL